MNKKITQSDLETIRQSIGTKSIVLVGLMGAGKTTIGRRLAQRLDLKFLDADQEIEKAAGMSVSDIFAQHGEAHFREGERKVIARLLESGPQILATGGGAYMDKQTRATIDNKALCIWLECDLKLLMKRVRKRGGRPLLKAPNPEGVMKALMDERYPIYAKADVKVTSRDTTHNAIVNDTINALLNHFSNEHAATTTNANKQPASFDGAALVNVDLGARSYPIHIGEGLLSKAGEIISPLLSRPKVVVVTDENVAEHHLSMLQSSLNKSSIESAAIILPPGEATKSYEQLQFLCDALLEADVERNDIVVAFGGGVIGDLAGFAAAILRRGVNFVQIPTSLLAQVDSSVGGKTGINSKHGKNLVGAFHQPLAVIVDIALLDTLPPRELASGYAEVAKYGLLGDVKFFEWLEENASSLFAGDAQTRITAISKSCEAKADTVARDEKEGGVRALLNLGHTFGHALEGATGYGDRLLHGEGVSIGIVLAFRFCEKTGLVEKGTSKRVEKHLSSIGLPITMADIKGELPSAERLVDYMRQDKKASGGKLVFVLANDIGDTFVAKDVNESDILAFMEEELAKR